MNLFALLISLALLIVVTSISFRGSAFSFAPARGQYGGLYLLVQIVALVAVQVVLVNFFGTSSFHQYRNTPNHSVPAISAVILLTVSIFIVIAGALARKFAPLRSNHVEVSSRAQSLATVQSASAAALIGIVACTYASVAYGAKNVMIAALLSGAPGDLLSGRLANVYETGMPTLFNSFVLYCSYVLAVMLGILSTEKRTARFFILLIVLIYLATFQGSKAPLLDAFLLFFFARLISLGIHFRFRGSPRIIAGLAVAVGVVLFSVKLQYPHMNSQELSEYLVARLGVGQMAGTFEQFNLKIKDAVYIWHTIPFANFFVDAPSFQKDLMLISEHVLDPSRVGVKNTYFIAEAYAIGGYWLVWLSPIWVAFVYVSSYVMTLKLWRKLFFAGPRVAPIVALVHAKMCDLTGGLSGFIFYKTFIMIVGFMLFVWITKRYLLGALRLIFVTR